MSARQRAMVRGGPRVTIVGVMRTIVSLSLALALGLLACKNGSSGNAGNMVVRTSGADVSSLAAYRTYSHAVAEEGPSGYAQRTPRPEVLDRIRRDVDAELQGKGYLLAEGGELVVRVSTGSRTVTDEPTGRAGMVGVPASEETEGALVIDILERGSGRQVFHGFARDEVTGDRASDDQIYRAVKKILEPVPVRSTR